MKLYKLTDRNNKTQADEIAETVWGPNVTHTASGSGTELCTDGVIHAYLHPRLAVILNPAHADFSWPKLWEAEGEIVAREGQLKVGCKSLTTIKEIPLPEITDEQKIKFAIYCALEVYQEEKFVSWANKWLSGEDRTAESADRMASPLAAELGGGKFVWDTKLEDVHMNIEQALKQRVLAASASAAWAAARACSNGHSASARSLTMTTFAQAELVSLPVAVGAALAATQISVAAAGNKDIDLIAILDKAMK
jgi:hypothetical protein